VQRTHKTDLQACKRHGHIKYKCGKHRPNKTPTHSITLSIHWAVQLTIFQKKRKKSHTRKLKPLPSQKNPTKALPTPKHPESET